MSAAAPAVLFVCLGNICRSPLAEVAFRAEAEKAGLDVRIDSAGTGDHERDSPPDDRAQAVARRAGLDISMLRARQIEAADFARFTHILAMDRRNLADIRAIVPARSRAEISLLLDHVPGREGSCVADPYFGSEAGFDTTWEDVTIAAKALVREFAAREGARRSLAATR